MKNFLKHFIIFFLILETSLFFWFFFDNEVNSHEFFLKEFVFFLLLNFCLKDSLSSINLNLDIIFKYLVLLLKSPSLFLNYFLNILKKVFVFLYFYKYRHILNSLKIYYKLNVKNLFLPWRPLFKKTSYFGYFRSNRSKWIK